MPPQSVSWELLTVRLGSSTAFAKTRPLDLTFTSSLSFGMMWFQREVPVSFLSSRPFSGSVQGAAGGEGGRAAAPVPCHGQAAPALNNSRPGVWEGAEPCSSALCWPCAQGHCQQPAWQSAAVHHAPSHCHFPRPHGASIWAQAPRPPWLSTHANPCQGRWGWIVGTLPTFVSNSCVVKQNFIHNSSEMVKVLVRQWDQINLWLKLITCVYFFEKPMNKKKKNWILPGLWRSMWHSS